MELLHVVGVLGELGGDHDLVLGNHRLGVVALDGAGAGAQEAAVGVGGVGGRFGVGGLVAWPGLELPRWAALGAGGGGSRGDPLGEALLAFGCLRLQPGLGLAQPGQPAGLAGQGLGQLVATGIPEQAILVLVGLGGLPQDLGDLALELVVGAVGLVGGVAGQLGAVQGHGPDADHAGGGAQPQGLDRKPARACWWRARKRAMVTWSGVWLAARTRKAMSSWQRRSSCREERTPIAYA